MGKQVTLAQWLIRKINTKDWRIGKVSGWKHPEVTQDIMDQIGRQDLLNQARELERLGMIRAEWREFGQDIRRIHINVDKMADLCQFAGEENPRKQLLEAREVILHWRKDADEMWKEEYYDYLLEQTEKGYIPAQVQDINLFQCLNRLPGQERDCWERVFSVQVLGNSKLFRDRYRNRLLTILRDYSPYVVANMEDDEILAEHGILTYAQKLEWKGPLVYELDGYNIDTSNLIYGTVINAQTLEHGSPVNASGIKKIVTIENKANYEDAPFQEDTLYIFTHGFFSPKERRFLKKLRERAGQQVEYYHWGDMDYGGIRIFMHLKQYVFPEVRPLYMDVENFNRALEAGGGILLKEEKREKLAHLEVGELEALKHAILESGMEIEQEMLLVIRCIGRL